MKYARGIRGRLFPAKTWTSIEVFYSMILIRLGSQFRVLDPPRSYEISVGREKSRNISHSPVGGSSLEILTLNPSRGCLFIVGRTERCELRQEFYIQIERPTRFIPDGVRIASTALAYKHC